MRILLAQNSRYYPAHGGGDKSNRLLMEALAARGHTCAVLARISQFGAREHDLFLNELAARNVTAQVREGVVSFERGGVAVDTVTNHPSLRACFAEKMAAFQPDVILASTDDPAQLLLEPALRAEGARVVYLARATLALPFGPDCAFPSAQKTEMLRRADAVAGVSQYVADYIRRWSGIEAVHVPISLLEAGPYPALGRFDNEFVTLVNPCAVKGISIFLRLAERMPHVRFAAVPLWGTNEQDGRALAQHANISILPPVDRVEDLLARTRVLLVPSLWAEARSRIVLEAMLHGVPVIASNVGGIPEAKLGIDYLLPVRPIEKYQERVDDQMVPIAEVPEQDSEPWYKALHRLLSDRGHYEQLSQTSRSAALAYAGNLSVEPFEGLLESVLRQPKAGRPAPAAQPVESDPLANLSPERRQLFALRLQRLMPKAQSWFPAIQESAQAKLRLFCFPYAGGGAGVFRDWPGKVQPGVALCPVRFPGRESRIGEPVLSVMSELLGALKAAIAPYLDKPFAFFGHSLGAVIAFELARALRGHEPPIQGLFVCAARAPQLRRGYVPPAPPSDGELMEELRRLNGVPRELLEHEEWMRLALPALRADAALYRNYVYQEGPPLDCPIRAYGGSGDERITQRDLEMWAEQTTSSFGCSLLPGGHFFIQEHQTEFWKTLSMDIQQLVQIFI
ncbi:MAG TPA: alpha/beta fold hydrolase [Bryobacteraceae bacterium]|nr:alpha/beta fold hydrolase [Bryobacteraceae bacterium]